MNLRDIAEVREVDSKRVVNDLLERGYQLLAVESTAKGVERKVATGATFYVEKKPVYIVGRTAEQSSILDVLKELSELNRQRREAERLAQTEQAGAGALI